jgi:hypothetical protein
MRRARVAAPPSTVVLAGPPPRLPMMMTRDAAVSDSLRCSARLQSLHVAARRWQDARAKLLLSCRSPYFAGMDSARARRHAGRRDRMHSTHGGHGRRSTAGASPRQNRGLTACGTPARHRRQREHCCSKSRLRTHGRARFRLWVRRSACGLIRPISSLGAGPGRSHIDVGWHPKTGPDGGLPS